MARSDAVEAARTPSESAEPKSESGGNGEPSAPKPKTKSGSSLDVRFKGHWQRFDKATGGNGIVTVAIAAVAVGVFVVLRALR